MAFSNGSFAPFSESNFILDSNNFTTRTFDEIITERGDLNIQNYTFVALE